MKPSSEYIAKCLAQLWDKDHCLAYYDGPHLGWTNIDGQYRMWVLFGELESEVEKTATGYPKTYSTWLSAEIEKDWKDKTAYDNLHVAKCWLVQEVNDNIYAVSILDSLPTADMLPCPTLTNDELDITQ
jgi:hypothetical protein